MLQLFEIKLEKGQRIYADDQTYLQELLVTALLSMYCSSIVGLKMSSLENL